MTILLVTAGSVVASPLPASANTTLVTTWTEVKAAFTAASGVGNVVTLGENIAGPESGEGLVVPAGATVSLNLGGYSLSVTGEHQNPGIAVGPTSELLIDGPGNLKARGSYGSAGIGGSMVNPSAGTIRILGGTIDAAASSKNDFGGAAGIGGGGYASDYRVYGDGGIVEIRGGVVTAQGGTGGAGIGAGELGTNPTIIISGGAVTATGGYAAAGLGGSSQTSGGVVSILGGEINAIAGAFGAGIGSGNISPPMTITIAAGTVRATGSNYGAAIGGASQSPGANLTIGADATVTAIAVAPGMLAFGRGFDGIGASPSFGSMNSAGHIILPARWTTQPGQVITNTGLIENLERLDHAGLIKNSGVLDNSGYLIGSGSIENSGTIRNTKTLSTPVSGDAFPFTLHANDGGPATPLVAVYSKSMDAAELPTSVSHLARLGFDQHGWSTAPSGGAPWNTATAATMPTSLYAQWEIAMRVVTFDAQNGQGPTTQSVEYDTAPSEPSAPTRAHHSFLGWFDQPVGGLQWDFGTGITTATTVYAQWALDTHVVTFEPGNNDPSTVQTVDYGSLATEPVEPARTGFTFTGWFTDAALKTPFNFEAPITVATTVYAGWKSTAVTPTPTPT
ncbi:InlB B-repeat-containing protein, partial [Glaciibacter psychrotolerans]